MSDQTLYAGFHCMKVEPPMGIHVPGYYEKRYSDGFLTDLHIRACAFKCGEEKAVSFRKNSDGFYEIDTRVEPMYPIILIIK